MNQKLLTVTFALLAFSGCAANQQWIRATPEQRKVMFENNWNSTIGKPFVPYSSTILNVGVISNDKREYIIKQLNECQIALLIDEKNSILISWHYVSEQRKCAEYFYSPGA